MDAEITGSLCHDNGGGGLAAQLRDRVGVRDGRALAVFHLFVGTAITDEDIEAAREAIFELLSIFDVAAVDRSVCIDALSLPMTDYEVAVMAACADRDGAGYIVTRDTDFVKAGINSGCSANVMYPADVLKLIEESE